MAGKVYEKYEGAAFQQLSISGGNYQRHEPEKTVLYQLVSDELNTQDGARDLDRHDLRKAVSHATFLNYFGNIES